VLTYQESLAYLDELLAARQGLPRSYTAIKLERMRRLCELLGHPERAAPVVLVAGTKGKGSTAAMIAAIVHAAGRRVGLYTKPHLVDVRERVRVNGELVTAGNFAALVERMRDAIDRGAGGPGWPPTYFEAAAALALLKFAQEAVDLAVVEVGIGGRLDATNVVDPVVSVITTIGYDHQDIVGKRLSQIAAEDAGIMRAGRTVISAPQRPAAARVLRQAAAAAGATLVRVGREIRVRTLVATAEGIRLTVRSRRQLYRDLRVPLLGRHQATNAACAIGAIEALADLGVAIGEPAVRTALAGLQWPARIEIVRSRPTVVVDVAHNTVSFQALRAALDEAFPGRRLLLVLGLLGDKDLEGIARIIVPRAAVVFATRPHDPRAVPAEAVAAAARGRAPTVLVVEDPVAATEAAVRMAGPEDVVCATGSFHVAGPVRAHLLGAPSDGAAPATTGVGGVR
jgi:dihydrofolate synthase/folylpolyglutamate synthase